MPQCFSSFIKLLFCISQYSFIDFFLIDIADFFQSIPRYFIFFVAMVNEILFHYV